MRIAAAALLLGAVVLTTSGAPASFLEELHRSEIEQTLRFQEGGGWAEIMKWISRLGPGPFIAVFAFLYLSVDSRIATRLILLYFLSACVRDLLAMSFRSPRPYWLDSRVTTFTAKPFSASSYSFPSGHATVGTTLWVYAASLVNKPWAWVAGFSVAILICISRVYLGVHYISDVVAGFLLGLFFVLCFRIAETKLGPIFKQMSFGKLVAYSALAAFAMIAAAVFVRWAISNSPDPADWATFAKRVRTLKGVAKDAGVVLGLGVGIAMSRRWAPFDASGPWGQRILRTVIAAAVIGPLVWLFRKKIPQEPEVLGTAIQFSLAMFGAWTLSFLLPWIFLRTGLAPRALDQTPPSTTSG